MQRNAGFFSKRHWLYLFLKPWLKSSRLSIELIAVVIWISSKTFMQHVFFCFHLLCLQFKSRITMGWNKSFIVFFNRHNFNKWFSFTHKWSLWYIFIHFLSVCALRILDDFAFKKNVIYFCLWYYFISRKEKTLDKLHKTHAIYRDGAIAENTLH